MISIATSCPFFTDSLPKFASASSSMAKLPSKPAADLCPPSVPTVTKPCFNGLSTFAGCSVKPAETSHERAVVTAAAHLQHATIPRGRQIDLELQVRRRRVLRLDDAGDLAEVAVRVVLGGRRDGNRRLNHCAACRQAQRHRWNRHALQARAG